MLFGYGVMRDYTSDLLKAKVSLTTPLEALLGSFLAANKSTISPSTYIAFVKRDDKEIIRQVYDVGTTGMFACGRPVEN